MLRHKYSTIPAALFLCLFPLFLPALESESSFFEVAGESGVLNFDPASSKEKLTPFASIRVNEPVPHDASMAVIAEFDTSHSFVLGMEAGLTNGKLEIFRRQEIMPGNSKAIWLIETRIGKPDHAEQFYLEVGGDQNATARLLKFEVVPVESLSVEEVFAATGFESLAIAYPEYNLDQKEPQEVSIKLPAEVARRFLGQQLAVIFDEKILTVDITETIPGARMLFEEKIAIPVDENELGIRNIRVTIQTPEGEKLHEVDSVPFTVRGSQPDEFKTFQMPFRTIQDFTAIYNKPDLRLMVLPRDIHVKPEPAGFDSSTHELVDYTISLKTGRNRPHVGWRIPQANHWAEEGFSNLALGRFLDAYSIYVTGGNAANADIVGHAAVISGSPLGAPANNPIYYPTQELTGWQDGYGLEIQTAGATLHYSTFVHLTQTAVHGEAPRMIAAISENVRRILDVRRVDDLESGEWYDHLQLFGHEESFYLIANHDLWSSTDPFGTWEKTDFRFDEDTIKPRLIDLEDEGWHHFWLEDVNGTNVVRYSPFEMNQISEKTKPEMQGS